MLEIKNVTLLRDNHLILDNLCLTIKPNEIHSILGMNGTGKSTLAYAVMGLTGYDLKSGEILWFGNKINHLSVTERAKLGITLAWQEPTRFEGLTVREYFKISGKNSAENLSAEQALDKVGLEASRYLNRGLDASLSGGERKRIELAAVLMMKPKLAILDEPDSGIDALSIDYIKDVIRELIRNQAAVMLITHHEEVAAIADRASALCSGRIIRTGSPEEVTRFFRNHCRPCQHINQPSDEVFSNA
jgi:Fe-S cluster assembly ATP-binding protein